MMFINIIIILSAIQIGIRKIIFNIFDKLKDQSKSITKYEATALITYIMSSWLFSVILYLSVIYYFFMKTLGSIGGSSEFFWHEMTSNELSMPLYQTTIIAIVLVLHTMYVILPLIHRMKIINSRKQ